MASLQSASSRSDGYAPPNPAPLAAAGIYARCNFTRSGHTQGLVNNERTVESELPQDRGELRARILNALWIRGADGREGASCVSTKCHILSSVFTKERVSVGG